MDPPSGQSLHHKDSQATLISLLQLDPSPIDTPGQSDDNDDNQALHGSDAGSVESNSSTMTAGTTTAPGLGSHGGRSAVYYRLLFSYNWGQKKNHGKKS